MLEEWIVALRSGKYQQAKDRLRTDGGYCCLGVLCDITDPKGWEIKEGCWEYYGETAYPTHAMIEQLGELELHDGYIGTLNDMRNMSFAEIADGLEAGTFKGKRPC
jgi:hypothetical protein